MGQQQSKEELLYQQVIEGNIEAIKAIHNNGASLEWIDKEGKMPLIVACMKPNGLDVAKALLELGANVNAYRPGYHAGTALHHAAKRGLEDTVRLLLSYGANPLIKNDGCQTPLEVARAKGFSNVVRTIEDAQPRNVIALWKANVEEIRWQHSDPVLTIFDNTSNTQYKFTSVSDSEQQQLQLLHKACNAATEVLPPRLSQNSQTTVQQSETAAQAMELAIGINASIHSSKENKVLHHHGQSSGVKNENDWCNTTDDIAHNGWGSLVRAQPTSEIIYRGWTDDQIKVQENGWGSTADVSSQRRQHSLPRPTSSELSCSGWNDEPAVEEYNGWAVPQPRPGHRDASAEVHYQGWGKTAKDSALPSISKTASSGVSSCETMEKTDNAPEYTETQEGNLAFDFVAPSAPPVPDEVVHEEVVHYPAIDLSPLNLSIPPGEQAASVTTERENKHETALCIICWEASVEGACVPCGHMIGCMQCLNQINSKKGECPVCRVKIDQVIKLYSV
ncbi:putative E3 ubiquitin-protein ligase XBAT35 isoform X2 [Nicotiana tabacum]|uniref:E3 ubiquitin-protein ligase XBAT35 isoform X2 n=2 Tax=Nicotiana TaxID=4085 RepID=A0AC58U6V7_TOBAC|nr:PREDICTED: putative E3 ubiquitin-protein ligase XBAT35 isoform X2 [Nicotiana sylvestris]